MQILHFNWLRYQGTISNSPRVAKFARLLATNIQPHFNPILNLQDPLSGLVRFRLGKRAKQTTNAQSVIWLVRTKPLLSLSEKQKIQESLKCMMMRVDSAIHYN